MEKSDTRRGGAIFLAPAAAILLFASGLVQARTPDLTNADRTFVKEAIQGDLAEIQIGKLAQQRGLSESVKQFGERLEADHGANLKKAKSLAESLGSAPPTAPNSNQKRPTTS
jgi:putative membrane protein